jgi:hypothetical protein
MVDPSTSNRTRNRFTPDWRAKHQTVVVVVEHELGGRSRARSELEEAGVDIAGRYMAISLTVAKYCGRGHNWNRGNRDQIIRVPRNNNVIVFVTISDLSMSGEVWNSIRVMAQMIATT